MLSKQLLGLLHSKSSSESIRALDFAYRINEREVLEITEFCSRAPRNTIRAFVGLICESTLKYKSEARRTSVPALEISAPASPAYILAL